MKLNNNTRELVFFPITRLFPIDHTAVLQDYVISDILINDSRIVLNESVLNEYMFLGIKV